MSISPQILISWYVMISLQKLIDDVVEIKFALIVSQLISLEEREQFMTVKVRVFRIHSLASNGDSDVNDIQIGHQHHNMPECDQHVTNIQSFPKIRQ